MNCNNYDEAWLRWAECYMGGWRHGDKAICTAFITSEEAIVEIVPVAFKDMNGELTGEVGYGYPEYPHVKVISARAYEAGTVCSVHWSHLKRLHINEGVAIES